MTGFQRAQTSFDPDAAPGRQLVRSLRGLRAGIAADAPVAVWDEQEVLRPEMPVACRVVILAGAECRYTCATCDLWRHTLPGPTVPGTLPRQVRLALGQPPGSRDHAAVAVSVPPPPRWLKLYNGSNFFDPRSVPPADLPAIADLVAGLERLVVENHPHLTGSAIPRFRDLCRPRLEVAMGLETVNEEVLARLGKSMTLDDYAAACRRLLGWGIDLRAFVLLGLPWIDPSAAVEWAARGVAFAAAHGARHVSVVPTRGGNGFLEALAEHGRFRCPEAATVERAAEELVARASRGTQVGPEVIVTIDLWDFSRLAGTCDRCRDPRRARLERMNLAQAAEPPIQSACGCQG